MLPLDFARFRREFFGAARKENHAILLNSGDGRIDAFGGSDGFSGGSDVSMLLIKRIGVGGVFFCVG